MSDNDPRAVHRHEPERRVHHRVRAVFGEAAEIIAPLLAGRSEVSGFALVHLLRSRFPELSDEELAILSAAATRLRQR